MSNFKVGDKVRRIRKDHPVRRGQPIGTIGTVSEIDGDGDLYVKVGTDETALWQARYAQLVVPVEPAFAFKSISGERARTYTFPCGATLRVENVTGLCVRPTNHRLETSDGRKLIVPGKFIAIEIEADRWDA